MCAGDHRGEAAPASGAPSARKRRRGRPPQPLEEMEDHFLDEPVVLPSTGPLGPLEGGVFAEEDGPSDDGDDGDDGGDAGGGSAAGSGVGVGGRGSGAVAVMPTPPAHPSRDSYSVSTDGMMMCRFCSYKAKKVRGGGEGIPPAPECLCSCGCAGACLGCVPEVRTWACAAGVRVCWCVRLRAGAAAECGVLLGRAPLPPKWCGATHARHVRGAASTPLLRLQRTRTTHASNTQARTRTPHTHAHTHTHTRHTRAYVQVCTPTHKHAWKPSPSHPPNHHPPPLPRSSTWSGTRRSTRPPPGGTRRRRPRSTSAASAATFPGWRRE